MTLRGIEDLKLEPGEEVFFIPPYPKNNYEKHWQILTVERITKNAGQIVTTDKRRFDKDGFEIGGNTSYAGGKGNLRKLTEELRIRVEYARNIDMLENLHWPKLDPETVNKIVTLIKSNGPASNGR